MDLFAKNPQDIEKTIKMLRAFKARFGKGKHIVTLAPEIRQPNILYVVFVNVETMEKVSMQDLNIKQRMILRPKADISSIVNSMKEAGYYLSSRVLDMHIIEFNYLFDKYIENARCN